MNGKPILPIALDRRQKLTLQDQLYSGLCKCIQGGVLASGKPVPSTRELALDLGVSRNTVIAAYDRLLGEGYLESLPRSGIFVRPEYVAAKTRKPSKLAPAVTPKAFTELDSICVPPVPFRPCQPDVSLFPLAMWNRMRSKSMKKFGLGLLHYQSKFALGLPSLRAALADYLKASRGVSCDWNQIAITGGSQQALFLLAQLLVKPGEPVMLEDPGYRGARLAMEHLGARIQSMPVDAEGAVLPETTAAFRVLYTTPSRQFPTGACMPVARRMGMIQSAKRANAWLIEDDYDSEFRYARPPLPSLHSLDPSGNVIYVGSMSKVLFPSLRIGYVVLPERLVEKFEALRLTMDDHGPLVDQATLAEFIASGAFYSHIRRCRKVYANKLEVFLEGAYSHELPIDFPFIDGGMNLTGYFNNPRTNAERAAVELKLQGLDIPPLSNYCIHKRPPGLVFGFTAFDLKTIKSSMAKVAWTLKQKF